MITMQQIFELHKANKILLSCEFRLVTAGKTTVNLQFVQSNMNTP